MNGKPGAADAQFWLLLAGVIVSHTGPLINGPIVGSSLREQPWMLKLQQTCREKTTIIWPLSMTRGFCKNQSEGGWKDGRSIWGKRLIGKDWGL